MSRNPNVSNALVALSNRVRNLAIQTNSGDSSLSKITKDVDQTVNCEESPKTPLAIIELFTRVSKSKSLQELITFGYVESTVIKYNAEPWKPSIVDANHKSQCSVVDDEPFIFSWGRLHSTSNYYYVNDELVDTPIDKADDRQRFRPSIEALIDIMMDVDTPVVEKLFREKPETVRFWSYIQAYRLFEQKVRKVMAKKVGRPDPSIRIFILFFNLIFDEEVNGLCVSDLAQLFQLGITVYLESFHKYEQARRRNQAPSKQVVAEDDAKVAEYLQKRAGRDAAKEKVERFVDILKNQ